MRKCAYLERSEPIGRHVISLFLHPGPVDDVEITSFLLRTISIWRECCPVGKLVRVEEDSSTFDPEVTHDDGQHLKK